MLNSTSYNAIELDIWQWYPTKFPVVNCVHTAPDSPPRGGLQNYITLSKSCVGHQRRQMSLEIVFKIINQLVGKNTTKSRGGTSQGFNTGQVQSDFHSLFWLSCTFKSQMKSLSVGD